MNNVHCKILLTLLLVQYWDHRLKDFVIMLASYHQYIFFILTYYLILNILVI